MRPLSTQELFRAWERGHPHDQTTRALLLLAYASPGEGWDQLAALPIGARDSRLLTLREWTFGSTLESLVTCPSCGSTLELTFAVADVRASPTTDDETLTVQVQDYEVDFRLPDSADLASLASVEQGRQQLLARCIQRASHNGEQRAADDLPDEVVAAVVARMSEADPQAAVETMLACPDCGHTWRAVFDVVSFFWEEVDHWAQRTIRDVHVLASTYGWGEDQILALSPWRRQQYLELMHR